MKEEAVEGSTQEIKDKWKTLKRNYTEIVDLNTKSGNSKHTFKYNHTFSQLWTKPSRKRSFVLDTSSRRKSNNFIVENEVKCIPNNYKFKGCQCKENVNVLKVTFC